MIPTTLGAALFKAATTYPQSNHPVARIVRNKIVADGSRYSVQFK